MLTLFLSALLVCQDPKPVPPSPPVADASASKSSGTVQALPAMSDRDARTAVRNFKRAIKGKRSMAERMKAVEALATGSNKALVAPLSTVIASDKWVLVRKRAAEALSLQPAKQAQPAILKLLEGKGKQGKPAPPVMVSLVDGLSRVGYRPKDWKLLEKMFERDYAAERVPLQEAIINLVIAHKETQAIDMLLENLDEPAPVDVDSPTNPPASYWEARWKAWRVWRPRVKEAVFVLTGQKFSTAQEARNWLRKNPLK